MLVQGLGRSGAKKKDNFDSTLVESEKLLGQILQSKSAKERYNTINTATIHSITLEKDPAFASLKEELDSFNEEVKTALETKSEIPNYQWKYNLHIGLRNLLKEIVSTEDRNLKALFLEKAKLWYFDKMIKKGECDETKLASRPGTTQSELRPITAGTRPFTAMTRPFTSQTNRISEFNNSVNISVIPAGDDQIKEKSYFDHTTEEIIPSKLRADILRDYEEGARSKHDLVEPPYERLSEYERKLPQGILKPSSRVGVRPQTSKTTTFAHNDGGFKLFGESQRPTFVGPNDEGLSQGEEAEAEGEEGGEENEGDGELPPPKAGIVVPARKLYISDKISNSQPGARDMTIPMESRSNYANYVPDSSVAEAELEQRWRNAMNKKAADRREKGEFRAMMNQWSHTKSRLDEEITRKSESNSFGSRFHQRTFVPRAKSANVTSGVSKVFKNGSQVANNQVAENEQELGINAEDEISERDSENEDEEEEEIDHQVDQKITLYRETGNKRVGLPEMFDYTKTRPKSVATGNIVPLPVHNPLEQKMNQARIDRIAKLHSDLIFTTRGVTKETAVDATNSVNRAPSLSIYDQNKEMRYRPFSAVIHTAKPENFRKDQMNEIEEIKAKLAKFKIKVPVKQLKTSILLPEVNHVALPKFPEPGAGLMKNPFYKEKKKKGGKKKGGKKK